MGSENVHQPQHQEHSDQTVAKNLSFLPKYFFSSLLNEEIQTIINNFLPKNLFNETHKYSRQNYLQKRFHPQTHASEQPNP